MCFFISIHIYTVWRAFHSLLKWRSGRTTNPHHTILHFQLGSGNNRRRVMRATRNYHNLTLPAIAAQSRTPMLGIEWWPRGRKISKPLPIERETRETRAASACADGNSFPVQTFWIAVLVCQGWPTSRFPLSTAVKARALSAPSAPSPAHAAIVWLVHRPPIAPATARGLTSQLTSCVKVGQSHVR